MHNTNAKIRKALTILISRSLLFRLIDINSNIFNKLVKNLYKYYIYLSH